MTIEKILIVDDELLIRNFLSETLKRQGFDVDTAENGKRALQLAKEQAFDLVMTDLKMPDMGGMEPLRHLRELSPTTLVIMMTAFGSVEGAVEAMRLGAYHYLLKPFAPDTVEALIEKAKQHVGLVEENRYLRQQVLSSAGMRKIVTVSGSMQQIMQQVQKIADSSAGVFITGESGTGKEVIAHAIHDLSPRSNRSYIRVNCAAIPDTLVESEFFGHEKGAFTGANQKRLGRFELANGGTLLLDEVTEIPTHLQPKLLRVLQEREFERIGGTKPVKVDVRIIATSNRDMKEAVAQKLFREDLYYRLNVVPLRLPPLRERLEDIVPLAELFLEQMCLENHRKPKRLSTSAKERLLEYAWPGNIRELANVLERTVVLDRHETISPDDLALELARAKP